MSIDFKPVRNQLLNYFSDTAKLFPPKKIPLLLSVVTFTILACLIGILAYQRSLINEVSAQKETKDFLITAKEKLQESLAQGISAAKTLSFFIQKDGTVKDFDSIASQIVASNHGIDILQLLPGGVIRYVYPLKGNSIVIGYDVLKDPTRNKEAFKAIQNNELFYAGPLLLKQGGLGIVGRLPVFRNNKFWGFSAVIIKMPTLLKAAEIDSLGTRGYFIQLSKINPNTHKEEFFLSLPKNFDRGNLVSVFMDSGEWKLSAIPVDSKKEDGDILWLIFLGFLFSLMGGVFVFTVMTKPEKLDHLVKMRTAALQESEERYRFLIEQASDGVIVYSFDGTIHHFNKSAYIETGYTREEFARLNLKDILLEKKVIVDQIRVDTLKSGKNATFRRKVYKKNGSLMDVEINVSMLPDTTLLAFVRNITDRQNAENALRESEEKFSKAFQSNLLAFAIYNDAGTVVDANERYAAMLQTTRDHIVGKNTEETVLLNKINPQKREETREAIDRSVAENRRLENFETQLETVTGNPTYLLLSIEPLVLNNQSHSLITAIDITEKKNAELSLVQNEIKYRSLIEQASDGIMISDFSGIITEVNNSMCIMCGYNKEEMNGKHIENFMPKADAIQNPLRIEDLVQGKTLRYERRMLKKDGTIIEVEINSKMAMGNTLVGFIRDITERKAAVEELKRSNERFELIARATKDAVWDHDFIKNETFGNENLYNLYGFVSGKDKIDFELFESKLYPKERETMMQNLQKAIRDKDVSISEEFRFKTADGSYKHFNDRAYIKYDDSGRPVRMMGVMQDITRSIKDRQQLLKQKELSDSIINSLPAVFYLYNKAGKFLRWNKNFETVTGYNAQEISNLHPLDLFDDKAENLPADKINNVFESGVANREADFLLKNKQKIPYYFSGMKIEYEGEICLMVFGLDFSDKVLSDKRIKESEQKFRSLVEQASDGVAILSLEGKPLYVSPSMERILGYTEAEMLNLNVFKLTHPGDRNVMKKLFEQVMQNPGIPVKGNISRVLHKDGTWRWLEDTITNMLHIPSINGIVENIRDITENLQIEKKIITEKELSDSIINSLPGIFYLYDKTGKFIRWNKNFEDVTGYNAKEIRQMHLLDFFDADQKPLVAERFRYVFKKKMPDAEFPLLKKDGKKIPFFYNSIAIEYEGLSTIVVMGFDVTERKKIEQELVNANQHLERKAVELTTSYSELERFAYIVSHDLQEPLRMVSSFLQLLEQKYKAQLDETAEKYIHFAVDGADRMKQLIADLLEYSRTGTNTEIAIDTNMNEVMTDVLNVLENLIREQNALVNIGHLPVLPATSKIQMFQLMQNLLGNAIKYRSEKQLEITINAKEEIDQWVFSIQDNGIGIEPKFFEKIFVIFQRLHNKNEYSGTGIGLSICKKIVEIQGGKIWVKSAVGNGSTFYFSIPKK